METRSDNAHFLWRRLQARSFYRGQDCYVTGGEMNMVLLVGAPPFAVVKVPHAGYQAKYRTLFELEMVGAISEAAPPQVDIPHVLDCDVSQPPYYVTCSYVPGITLTPTELRQYPPEDTRRVGAAVGRFVTWMEQAITPRQYGRLQKESAGSHPRPPAVPGRL